MTTRRGQDDAACAGAHRRPVAIALAVASSAVLLTGVLAAPDRKPVLQEAAVSATALAIPAPTSEPAAEPEPVAVPSASTPEVVPASWEPEVPELAVEPIDLRVIEGAIARGQSLSTALRSRGVGAEVVHTIATQMKGQFDFRYSRPGDTFYLAQTPDGALVEFRYSPSDLESYHLIRDREGYVSRKWEAPQIRRQARIAGVVTTSLYDAVSQLGEHPQLAGDFAEIFAWDVDFSHAVRAGDEFSILYERLFRELPGGGHAYEGPGRILAASYRGMHGEHEAIYFEVEEGQGGYYRPDGTSVQRQFLKAPLSYRRISSGFTLARLHPILKVRRPHPGIDYAAPAGTPVWAVGEGRVTRVGRNGGLGNTVTIRHANGYESIYGHLSRFAKGLRRGQVVSQKQVIGYVGSSGLATGPHLHFHMKKQGRSINPARIFSPAGPPIPESARGDFFAARDERLAILAPQPLAVTEEAL